MRVSEGDLWALICDFTQAVSNLLTLEGKHAMNLKVCITLEAVVQYWPAGVSLCLVSLFRGENNPSTDQNIKP